VVEDLEKIIKAALHARDVIRNLLLFARRVPPVRMKVRLNELVQQALELLEARCADTGVKLVRSLEKGLPDLTADPSQVRQVLVNLLVNAVQAMPEGGRLEVQTRSEAEHVIVAITDTGVGMSADVRKRLFTPFFTTKDVGEGTGLGLAVAAGIVSSHGGTIYAESEVGHGSRFEVRLPLTPPLSANLGFDEIPA
jgi:two-component system NtrC family sensor kinase